MAGRETQAAQLSDRSFAEDSYGDPSGGDPKFEQDFQHEDLEETPGLVAKSINFPLSGSATIFVPVFHVRSFRLTMEEAAASSPAGTTWVETATLEDLERILRATEEDVNVPRTETGNPNNEPEVATEVCQSRAEANKSQDSTEKLLRKVGDLKYRAKLLDGFIRVTIERERTDILRSLLDKKLLDMKLLGRIAASAREELITSLAGVMKLATETGSERCVKAILKSGADVNMRIGRHCFTALMIASKHRRVRLIKVLLASEADVNKKSELGETALHVAARRGWSERERWGGPIFVSSQIVDKPSKAKKVPYLKVMQLLIKAGADVNSADRFGKTPLIKAVKRSSIKSVELLLKSGADVNAVDNDGSSVLMESVKGWYPASAELLLRAGADVHRAEAAGHTALLHAAMDIHDPLPRLGRYAFVMRSAVTPFRIPSKVASTILLLAAGASVNITSYCAPVFPQIPTYLLLHASGENLDTHALREDGRSIEENLLQKFCATVGLDPEHLKHIAPRAPGDLRLKHMARVFIRNHVMKTHANQGLFHWIPQLGLPKIVTSYLLCEPDLQIDWNHIKMLNREPGGRT